MGELGAADGEQPLAGYHIVVDAGNGAGGFTPKRCWHLWEPTPRQCVLRAGRHVPQPHTEPPKNEAAMASISDAVRQAVPIFGVISTPTLTAQAASIRTGSR